MSAYQEQFTLRVDGDSDGNSDAYRIEASGLYRYYASGEWDGASLTLELKPLGFASFKPYQEVGAGLQAVLSATGTESDATGVFLSQGDAVRDVLSSAGGNTSLTSSLSRVDINK